MNIYDIGNITKYQLSKYLKKQQVENDEAKLQQNSFSYLYQYVMLKIPNSKVIVVGGSDDICRSVYDSKVFDHIVHMDSSIDVDPMFKLQIRDGKTLYEPTYHEHHRSHLR